MDDECVRVTCPYCGEPGEIYVEPDVIGQMVQDCEVCCNPWLVEVTRAWDPADVSRNPRRRAAAACVVRVRRADGSE